MNLTLSPAPPPHWKKIIRFPIQLPEYAQASEHLGLRSLFCATEQQAALVQLRDPLPPVGFLGRAYVYPSQEDVVFLGELVTWLRRRRIPFVRIGNTMWGVRDPDDVQISGCVVRVIERTTAVLDITRDETEILRGISGTERTSIRKAEREKVEVSEASDPDEVVEYYALAKVTAERIRHRSRFTEFPRLFFVDVYRRMIQAGYARLLLARVNGELIAGNLFFVLGDTMTYYHGASTRDRAHTFRQAPTACLWAGIRAAKDMGLTRFDLGGFTITADPADPRRGVYDFKRRWGGTLVKFYNAEIALSPIVYRLQQRIGSLLWQRLHPLLWHWRARWRGNETARSRSPEV